MWIGDKVTFLSGVVSFSVGFIMSQYEFRWRLILYGLLNVRGRSLIFKKHLAYSQTLTNKWSKHMYYSSNKFREDRLMDFALKVVKMNV